MAHAEQQAFVQSVKDAFPSFFNGGRVLEVGSLNINGTVRIFFDADEYIGIDVGEGRDVDIVANGHEYKSKKKFDCAISCECFEHNPFWKETFANMVKLVKSGGLVLFTCATTGRAEHGTSRSDIGSSPLTVGNGWDYYKNLTEQDFEDAFDLDGMFKEKCFSVNTSSHDLYFWGIKK